VSLIDKISKLIESDLPIEHVELILKDLEVAFDNRLKFFKSLNKK